MNIMPKSKKNIVFVLFLTTIVNIFWGTSMHCLQRTSNDWEWLGLFCSMNIVVQMAICFIITEITDRKYLILYYILTIMIGCVGVGLFVGGAYQIDYDYGFIRAMFLIGVQLFIVLNNIVVGVLLEALKKLIKQNKQKGAEVIGIRISIVALFLFVIVHVMRFTYVLYESFDIVLENHQYPIFELLVVTGIAIMIIVICMVRISVKGHSKLVRYMYTGMLVFSVILGVFFAGCYKFLVKVDLADDAYSVNEWLEENKELFLFKYIRQEKGFVICLREKCDEIAEQAEIDMLEEIEKIKIDYPNGCETYYDKENGCLKIFYPESLELVFYGVTSKKSTWWNTSIASGAAMRSQAAKKVETLSRVVYQLRNESEDKSENRMEIHSGDGVLVNFVDSVAVFEKNRQIHSGDMFLPGTELRIELGEIPNNHQYFLNGEKMLNGSKVVLGHNDLHIVSEKKGGYFSQDVLALKEFAMQQSNNQILKWNLDEPESWQGVKWEQKDEMYRITALELSDLEVSGRISLRDCAYLEEVRLSNTKIENVELPNAMKALSDKAFQNCDRLVDVRFGDDLQVIGASAFQGCDSICKIVLSEKLTRLEAAAFKDCSQLSRCEYYGEEYRDMEKDTFSGTTKEVTWIPKMEFEHFR